MDNNKPLKLADVNIDDLSPMMKQYVDMKKSLGDTILFYRLGDFYEMFFDDAIYVSRALELTLTARDCGNNLRAPMCGVPFHAYSTYANRLISIGNKVAICEQLEDPALAKGLVKRGLIKVLTPGTLTDLNGLEEKRNNYLMSIYSVGSQYGISVADITTGLFEATELIMNDSDEHLINMIGKYMPSEIIYNQNFETRSVYLAIKNSFEIAFTKRVERDFSSKTTLNRENNKAILGIKEFHDPELLLCASGALLTYADETQAGTVSHLENLRVIKTSNKMELDYSTRTNLELTETIRGKNRRGSLLWAIDKTKTAMGGRMLRSWVEEPLLSVSEINSRLDAITELNEKYILRQEIIEALTGLHDIERLSSRVALGSVNARDLLSLKNALGKLPFIIDRVKNLSYGVFREINENLDDLSDVYELLEASIAPEPPIGVKDGDIIKRGYNKDCDELFDIATNAKEYIMAVENREKEETGIKNLKIGYNRVFGYYIEISKANNQDVPDTYIRKQTLANAERYVTDEIKKLEDKILGAQTKRTALEYGIFCDIRNKVALSQDRLFSTARAVAILDTICSLSELASSENYCRPDVDNSEVIEVTEGRHPVVEKMLSDGVRFIPNDTVLDDSSRLMVLTGPNMAGKSTYMRQVAIIVLLAQIGSYVPAKSAHIGLVDRIFTRIGASDDISMGQSTFMVEMSEVSNILKNATRRSLLLLDEVGRGTSTYDGLSIAWAVIEYILDPNILYSRTIFATHYHELNQLSKMHAGAFNNHVDVKETNDGVVFLHKIVDGGTSDSYGIEVARLAGIPDDVLKRSKSILGELERIGNFKVTDNVEVIDGQLIPSAQAMPGQGSIFNPDNVVYRKEDKLRKSISDIDITRITPLEAMNILYGLIDMLNNENNSAE